MGPAQNSATEKRKKKALSLAGEKRHGKSDGKKKEEFFVRQRAGEEREREKEVEGERDRRR
jgi:hypothetical protein